MNKIAIFLPKFYSGGTLRAFKSIAKGLTYQLNKREKNIKVVVSCLKGKYDLQEEFDDLLEMGIEIRETEWKSYNKAEAEVAAKMLNLDLEIIFDEYIVPWDGMNNFMDCAAWIIVSDRLPKPLLPLRKYACVVFDYFQRYVPDIFPDDDIAWDYNLKCLFYLVRNSLFSVVTTPSTQKDMIYYAGVPPSRVKLLSTYLFDPIDINVLEKYSEKENYFVWVTTGSRHKNQYRAFRALEKYYNELNGRLKVKIIGYNSDLFNPFSENQVFDSLSEHDRDFIQRIRDIIINNEKLRRNVEFMGNVTDIEYMNILASACFLWHTNIADNGAFSVIEAARVGTPSLSSKYPPMEYINEMFMLNLTFFDQFNYSEMAKSLKKMENEYMKIKLPPSSYYNQFGWKKDSEEIYETFLEIINLCKSGEDN